MERRHSAVATGLTFLFGCGFLLRRVGLKSKS
jgi:hypothetical protein